MKKIKILSNILTLIFTFIAIAIPFMTFYANWLIWTGATHSFFGINVAANSDFIPHSTQQFIICFFISLIPYGTLAFCFILLACLFKLYAKGFYFTDQNTHLYRLLGWALIIHFIATIMSTILHSLILTGPNYKFNFSGLSFGDILTGLVILCISWVFNEANKINEENKLTI